MSKCLQFASGEGRWVLWDATEEVRVTFRLWFLRWHLGDILSWVPSVLWMFIPMFITASFGKSEILRILVEMKVREWNFHNSLEVDWNQSGNMNLQLSLRPQCPLSPSMVHGGEVSQWQTQLTEEWKQGQGQKHKVSIWSVIPAEAGWWKVPNDALFGHSFFLDGLSWPH